MHKPNFIPLLLVSLVLTLAGHAEEKSGHLFILSGQSNMTGNLKKGFSEVATKALGEKDVTIVHCSRSGRGIRFWVADYKLPDDHPMAGLSKNKSNGEEFQRLVKAVRDAGGAEGFNSVHFIWMQGESDAQRDLGIAYEESFKKLTTRLKKELGIQEMNFVIGRISDFGLHNDQKKAGWQRVRAAQQKLGDEDPLGTWIDTDDFIAEEVKKEQGNLHYTPENSVKLGERFADAALKLWTGALSN